MKRKLLLLMIAAGTMLSAQVSIRIGPPPAIRYEVIDNRRPGPDYIWVDGYWYPEKKKYKWHQGYWTRAPFGGARWIAPRHEGGMFYNGYWGKDNDRYDHDHRWDRDRDDRDNNRKHDKH